MLNFSCSAGAGEGACTPHKEAGSLIHLSTTTPYRLMQPSQHSKHKQTQMEIYKKDLWHHIGLDHNHLFPGMSFICHRNWMLYIWLHVVRYFISRDHHVLNFGNEWKYANISQACTLKFCIHMHLTVYKKPCGDCADIHFIMVTYLSVLSPA